MPIPISILHVTSAEHCTDALASITTQRTVKAVADAVVVRVGGGGVAVGDVCTTRLSTGGSGNASVRTAGCVCCKTVCCKLGQGGRGAQSMRCLMSLRDVKLLMAEEVDGGCRRLLTNVPPSLISGSPSDHHPSVSNSSSIAPSPLYVKNEATSEEQHKALLHGILSSQSHHSSSSHIAAAAAILSYTGTNTATTTTELHYTPKRRSVKTVFNFF
ncbi:hypothetical protein V9T40_001285 [Parthenolecanium corni]|uniref:Uncharacterized protein n=1 Tax=Parthenolecanium corni TaxID=536013 RepID=A0AAN9TCK3_9HEMI